MPGASARPASATSPVWVDRWGRLAVAGQPPSARLVPGSNRFRLPFQSVSKSNNFYFIDDCFEKYVKNTF